MKDLKRTLTIAAVVILFSSMFEFAMLFSDIFYFKASTFNIVLDGIYCAISIATAITYFVMASKPFDYVVQNKKVFTIILILNVFNNFISWVVAFWVQFTVSKYQRVKFFTVNHEEINTSDSRHKNERGDEIILDKSDYEVKNKVDILTEEINKLNELRKNGAISEEEYQKLKQEVLERNFNL